MHAMSTVRKSLFSCSRDAGVHDVYATACTCVRCRDAMSVRGFSWSSYLGSLWIFQSHHHHTSASNSRSSPGLGVWMDRGMHTVRQKMRKGQFSGTHKPEYTSARARIREFTSLKEDLFVHGLESAILITCPDSWYEEGSCCQSPHTQVRNQ